MTGRLQGRAAIVTGAGSGIGRATTLRLLADGANVLAVDKNAQGLAETADLQGDRVGRCVILVRDITNEDAPDAMVATCAEAFGGVQILVNNAGT